uniref:Uncharacterized protein n=2 Tax=viral metagenome TaxID=1070528 RepID=A0A6H1Z9M8_9ZZZZ
MEEKIKELELRVKFLEDIVLGKMTITNQEIKYHGITNDDRMHNIAMLKKKSTDIAT